MILAKDWIHLEDLFNWFELFVLPRRESVFELFGINPTVIYVSVLIFNKR